MVQRTPGMGHGWVKQQPSGSHGTCGARLPALVLVVLRSSWKVRVHQGAAGSQLQCIWLRLGTIMGQVGGGSPWVVACWGGGSGLVALASWWRLPLMGLWQQQKHRSEMAAMCLDHSIADLMHVWPAGLALSVLASCTRRAHA